MHIFNNDLQVCSIYFSFSIAKFLIEKKITCSNIVLIRWFIFPLYYRVFNETVPQSTAYHILI